MRREEDLAAAAHAGADFIGINLWPVSPRFATPDIARRLLAAARGASPILVALLVDPAPGDIASAAEMGFTHIQIHGPYDRSAVPAGVAVIRAVEISGETDIARAEQATEEILLLDAKREGLRGGTGKTFDWSLASRVAARRKILLAGGLTPANVAEAVRRVRPWGVDTASGVEAAPGIKDAEKIASFLAAARGADIRGADRTPA